MSLDVYLVLPGVRLQGGSGIFVREGGQTREIPREEWDRLHPGQEPILGPSDDGGEVFDANITHNLNRMAGAAGIYEALWRPGELLDPEKAARIHEQAKVGNYHEPGGAYELERSLPPVHGSDLIGPLSSGLELLRSDPERFKAFNPENGWGDYDGLVEFVRQYLQACKTYPAAEVRVSR